MATISFRTNNIQIQTGSGLGFYGSTFGASVAVGAWQQKTFITNSAGTFQGPEGNNVQFLNNQSGILGGGGGTNLLAVPNYQSTLQVTFEHTSAVQLQNSKIIIYDGSNINNSQSGFLCYGAEVIHPDLVQNQNGSGDNLWISLGGSGSVLSLCPSPGVSGFYAGNGSNSTRPDLRHDYYGCFTASPSSIGSKTARLYFSTEYF